MTRLWDTIFGIGTLLMLMGLSETPSLLQMLSFSTGIIFCVAGGIYGYIGILPDKE
mgnify:CR=1 FL=1